MTSGSPERDGRALTQRVNAGLGVYLVVCSTLPLMALRHAEVAAPWGMDHGWALGWAWADAVGPGTWAGGAVVAWVLGVALLAAARPGGRWLVTGALAVCAMLSLERLATDPGMTLLVGLPAVGVLSRMWLFQGTVERLQLQREQHAVDGRAAVRHRHADHVSRLGRFASLGAISMAITASLDVDPGWQISHWAALGSNAIALGWLAWAFARLSRLRAVRVWLMLVAVPLTVLALALLHEGGRYAVLAAALPHAAAVMILPRAETESGDRIDWWEPIVREPARLFAVTFMALCVVASFLLALEVSTPTGQPSLRLVDAVFTAVSAVCVTGLVVLDTPNDFSRFGQVVILLAIQLGGLGVMTFSAAALRLLGRRLSVRFEGAVAELTSKEDRSRIFSSISTIFTITFVAEALGALVLAVAFLLEGDGLGTALWRGVFTAVSAFCNAGFALQPDSVVGYNHNGLVLNTISALVICGGISPAVVASLPALVRREQVSLQTRLVVAGALGLLVVGLLGFLAIEWNGVLAHLDASHKVANALLQSASARTAGFNSVPLEDCHPATLVMTMLLMFIGGAPGGTAGGIKITTAMVLLLAVATAIRGEKMITVWGRRISHRTVYRAAATSFVGVAAIVGFTMLLLLTQEGPVRVVVFEAVSALATVGLSIGGSGLLDGAGKVLIIVCMFIGRVGPLTLFMFVSSRVLHEPWQLPKDDIDVG